jgi:NAD-dependent deacetylase
MNETVEIARRWAAQARRVFVLTGAGISAESGVPTFRGGGGATTWRGMPFEQLSSAQMVARDLPLVWEWFDHRRSVVGECSPNEAHLALARAQRSGRYDSFTLSTQNVDGLHRVAGSEDLIELHGNVLEARCLSCRTIELLDTFAPDERPPICPTCGDSMRPNVVLFGELLNSDDIRRAQQAAENCDLCFVIGTSALVYPANDLPVIARQAGARVIEINPEETVLTPFVDLSIRGTASTNVPLILPSG